MFHPTLRPLAVLIGFALPALLPAACADDELPVLMSPAPAEEDILPALLPSVRALNRDVPRPRELRKLRVLLVIDTYTDSEMAASVDCDRRHVQELLENHVPEGRRQIDRLEGRKVTKENILKYYRELKVGPDEALLFFYAGHGGLDPKLGQCLQPQMGRTALVPRSEVRKAMDQKGAGLVVLLTDCCSSYLRGRPAVRDRETVTRVVLHPVLRCLFFQHRGTVDLTAAEDGTGAYADDQHGGVFTGALVTLLNRDLKTLDTDRDGFLSWKEFFPQLSRGTADQFEKFAEQQRADGKRLDQTTQRPRSFALPDGLATTEARTSYAVVSLHNDSGKAVRYRYRWTGEREWRAATVSRKGRVFHKLAVTETAKLPNLEIEAELGSERAKGSLKPARWTGTGRPGYEDGNEYNLIAR